MALASNKTRGSRRGIARGSRKGGWKAAKKSLSREERRTVRVEKRVAKDKRLDQIKRYQGLMEAATEKSQQLLYIGKVTKLVYGFDPKPEQAEALWWLIFEKKDLLLVAKTSFGKSLILQLLPCLVRDAIVLVLLPLNAIGAEQMEKIKTLPGAQPIHLTANNNNNQTLAAVRNGDYSHILVSPEIACSQRFRESVLSDSKLRSRIKAVMVDEVHLVVDWGLTFRESYTHLRYLRNVIGYKPWFGCTATLDRQSFEALCHSSGFSKNVRIMRTTINRPEIAIIRKELPQKAKSSFRTLYFLFEGAIEPQDIKPKPTPEKIKKSVIFFDSKRDMRSCIDILRSWLEEEKGYNVDEAKATICEYHATLSEEAKTSLYNEFKKSDSKIRILAATDALSLGCDVQDIEIVVQYGLPRRWNMSTVLQRFGRAARAAGCKAQAIFFIESRFIGPKESGRGGSKDIDPAISSEESDVAEDVSLEVQPQARRRTDAEARGELPEVMYEFCNSDRCLRKIILSHYLEELEGHNDTGPCCSNCEPDLGQLAVLDAPKSKRKHFLTGRKRHPIFHLMRGWCCNWVKDTWPTSVLEPDLRVLISEEELMTICDQAWLMGDVKQMQVHLPDWEWDLEVLDCLLKALHQARRAAQEADGEVSLIRQSLPDWPWQFVDTNKLSESLLVRPKGKQNTNSRGTQSLHPPDIILPERPRNRKAAGSGRKAG